MAVRQYRVVDHDTIQSVALRELGAATKWIAIAEINNLDYPYIDPELSPEERDAQGKSVAVTGDAIIIPIVDRRDRTLDQQYVRPVEDYYELRFKRDLEMGSDGDIIVDDANDDLRTEGGIANLKGALNRRLQIERGELSYHPRYGSLLQTLPGETGDVRLIARARIESIQAMLQDPRLSQLLSLTAEIDSDVMDIRAEISVEGRPGIDSIEANFTVNR